MISQNSTFSEMWGLKGGNFAVTFYYKSSSQSWKPGKQREDLFGEKMEKILGVYDSIFACTLLS